MMDWIRTIGIALVATIIFWGLGQIYPHLSLWFIPVIVIALYAILITVMEWRSRRRWKKQRTARL